MAQAPRRGAAYSHIPGYTRTQEEEDVLANEVMADGLLSCCCPRVAGRGWLGGMKA